MGFFFFFLFFFIKKKKKKKKIMMEKKKKLLDRYLNFQNLNVIMGWWLKEGKFSFVGGFKKKKVFECDSINSIFILADCNGNKRNGFLFYSCHNFLFYVSNKKMIVISNQKSEWQENFPKLRCHMRGREWIGEASLKIDLQLLNGIVEDWNRKKPESDA